MAFDFRKFIKGIRIVPEGSSASSASGDLEVDSVSGKLKYYNNSQTTKNSSVVTEDHTATLTNKTLDNAKANTITGTDGNNLQLSSSSGNVVKIEAVSFDSNTVTGGDSTLTIQAASTKNLNIESTATTTIGSTGNAVNIGRDGGTVKLNTYDIRFGATLADGPSISGSDLFGPGNFTFRISSGANQDLQLYSGAGLTNKTQIEQVAVKNNTITGGVSALTLQSASNQNLSLQAQGTGNLLLEDVIVNNNTITGGASALTIQSASNQNLVIQGQGTGFIQAASRLSINALLDTPTIADSTSGANSTLATPTKTIVRLTNSSLSSVNMIPAGVDGQQLTLINNTTAAITFNDDTGATIANRILTGTGAPVTIQNNASIELVYNGTTQRWMIVGGVGGSSSTVNATAGETLAIGDAVYISLGASDGGRTAGRVYKVDAQNTASPDTRIEYIGFAADAAIAGNSLRVQVAGELGGFTGLTAGTQLFASTSTPGGRQTAVPSVNGQWIIPLGIAKNSSTIVINGALSSTATKITGSSAGQFLNVLSASSNTTLTNNNDVILATGNTQLTLPIPSSGKTLTIKKTDVAGTTVVVLPAGSETIDGLPSYSISAQYQSITLTTNGTNWFII